MDLQALREVVSGVLGIELTAADDDCNLFELGLQSMDLMRLVSRLNREGLDASFAELAEAPRLSAWSGMLTPLEGGEPAPEAVEKHDDEADRSFPLTAVQQAYLIGRAEGQPLGGVGCHNYMEFDGVRPIEPDRLERAVRALLARHPMLRARFADDATQQVLPRSPWPGLTVHDLRARPAAEAEAAALELRERLSHRVLNVGRGEVIDVQLTRLPGGVDRLHFNTDLLVADLASFRLLLGELTALYEDPDSLDEVGYTFGRYLADQAAGRRTESERARPYWQRRVPSLPGGPKLPLAIDPLAVAAPRFARRYFDLTADEWTALERRGNKAGLTPSVVLATAYAMILSRWSGDERFLLGLPLFDRDLGAHPEIERVVGDFTGLVLLEVDLSGSGFQECARAVQKQVHEDIGHAAYSGVDVLRDLARSDPDAPRTAPVVFSLDLSAPLIPDVFAERFGDASWMISQTPQVWLDHQIYRTRDGSVRMVWDAVEELFPDDVLDTMMAAYEALVRELIDGEWETAPPRTPLPAAQRATREAVNASTRTMTGNLLHTAFFERAADRAARPALLWGDDASMTHNELARDALGISAALAGRGIGRGSYVAVVAPKGPRQIAAVLGVLAAGAAYVPVGVDQPAERRARILELSGAEVVLDGSGALGATEAGVEVLPIERALLTPPLGAPVPAEPGDRAYVIFTSGSTGLPKGVEVSHRAAVNTVEDLNERFGIGADDRVLAVSALDFDLSVWDVFGFLAVGGAAVLVPESGRRDATEWLTLCERHAVTVWNTVPALLEMALTAADGSPLPGSLRLALLSGDWIGLDLPERLARATDGRCRFISLGGATEAAIWSNAYEVTEVPAGWRSIPYGKPLRNQKFRVVDGRGRDCPDWVPGELWIGGAGVALGYRGDPELTAARFPEHRGERWYRTGDLGRYWPDGNLEFLGRLDHQVKINGFRVELGEIESCLQGHPEVAQAVAVPVAEGRRELVAAVVERSSAPDRVHAEPDRTRNPFLPPAATGETDPHQLEHRLVEVLLAQVVAPLTGSDGVRPSVCAEQRPVVDIWFAYLTERDVLVRAADGTHRHGARWDEVTRPEWIASAREAAAGTFFETVAAALRWAGPLLSAILSGDADATALLDDPVLAPEALGDLMPATADCLRAVAEDLRARGGDSATPRVAEWDVAGGRGTARLLAGLGSAPVDYTLLGSSKPALARTRTLLEEQGHRTRTAWQSPDAVAVQHLHTYDVVVANNVLHRMPDPDLAVATLALLLAPGGRLHLLERAHPTPLALVTALPLEARAGRFAAGRPETPWLHGAERWRQACTGAGLTDVRVLRTEPGGEILLSADRPGTAHGIDPAGLRGWAADRLPEHMVPAHFAVLPALPLSANGKIDRRQVRTILEQSVDRPRDVDDPPRGDTETFVADRWTKLVGLESVGRNENFFRLGGDSLIATRFVAEVRGAWGVELPMRDVIRTPTVAGLSALIDRLRAADAYEEGAV
ncbi:amino acid adenylation domain-containing protein [Streptomyces sp. NBC_01618]|uniref:amino acid adenylation domain-containing protein n=1 Tax=Streptomyces sp. NBC_01618 TaxID=2975900 RepID=UPI003868A806|nr:amino acid adenylation domain-containing protein [Streptomyces sp. NBC_01618]WTE38347.1 amino acid adenylation domain-containing protein [Streptomyces sp. NBC_01618]